MNWKGVERSRRDFITVSIPQYAWSNAENHEGPQKF
jgi:hypothetical protein